MKNNHLFIVRFCLSGLLLLQTHLLFAQALTGRVLDELGEPVAGVSVYFDGTTRGADTDASGRFRLNHTQQVNPVLVFSKMGYHTGYITGNQIRNHFEMVLRPRTFDIKEVEISGAFSRAQKLAAFRARFLGTDAAGKSCVIENEDDLLLDYDVDSLVLRVSAKAPLRIQNPYLGYRLVMDMSEFYLTFKKLSINPKDGAADFYRATTFFIDESDDKNKFANRREKSFRGSQMLFFRELFNSQHKEPRFMLRNGVNPVVYSDAFRVSDTLGYKKVEVLKNTHAFFSFNVLGEILIVKVPPGPPVQAVYTLIYASGSHSLIYLRTPSFLIDRFGNHSAGDSIQFDGTIARKRLGNLLPSDYESDP